MTISITPTPTLTPIQELEQIYNRDPLIHVMDLDRSFAECDLIALCGYRGKKILHNAVTTCPTCIARERELL